jgi:hypothetical protein
MPSLEGLPGSVQAELFVIYSTLKNLGVEMEHERAAAEAKRAAFRRWARRIRRLSRGRREEAWAARLTQLTASQDDSAVAAIVAETASADHPEWAAEKIMKWTIAYLAECNNAELSAFREVGGPSPRSAAGA